MTQAYVYNIKWEKKAIGEIHVPLPSELYVDIDEDRFDLEDEDDYDLIEFISNSIIEMTGLGHYGFEYHLEFNM